MVWGHLDWGFNYRPDLNTFSLFFLTFFLFSFSFYAVLLLSARRCWRTVKQQRKDDLPWRFSGHGSDGFMFGLVDLRDLFQS